MTAGEPYSVSTVEAARNLKIKIRYISSVMTSNASIGMDHKVS